MIHQFRDRKQIKEKKRFIKNLIFAIIFLLFAFSGVFTYSSGALHFIGEPMWKVKNNISQNIKDIGYMVRTKSSVYKENENLKKENSEIKIEIVSYRMLKDENIKLKEVFGRIPTSRDMVLANILTKPNYSPYDSIVIDIGEDHEIIVSDTVYANAEIPIGEVVAVYADTALVTLYSNPSERTGAMMSDSNTSVELIGRGGGNFEMTIPVDLTFTKGESVYLPSITTEIIAIINEVISSPNDPTKKLLLSTPLNVQNLKWVFVKRN